MARRKKHSLSAFVLLLTILLGSSTILMSQTSDQFFATGNLNVARSCHTATLLNDGRVLVAGGSLSEDFPPLITETAEIYDPTTHQFSMTGSLNVPRMCHSAVRLDDGRVLIVGGYYNYPMSVEFYDPASGTFSIGPALPRTLGSSEMSSVGIVKLSDGSVLIFGGDPYVPSNDVVKLDVATNTVSLVGHTLAATTGRSESMVTLLGSGKILVAGGFGAPLAELYDPKTNTSVATLNQPASLERGGPASALLKDGRLVMVGGASNGIIPTMLIYDPASGSFTDTGDTQFQAGWVSGVALPDGRALFVGSLQGVGLFDNVQNKLTLVRPITTAGGRTATLLKDGTVLIAGGGPGNFGPFFKAAELFVPSVPSAQKLLTLIFTNDVHGLWNANTEGGRTVLNRMKDIIAIERINNPDGVLAFDIGDIVAPEETVTEYAQYLQQMRQAGYDGVAVGNHDCCNLSPKLATGFDDPVRLRSAVLAAKAAGLHVLSANVNLLAQQPELNGNTSDWIAYENEVERSAVLIRKGINIGVFGLTPPQSYGRLYDRPPFINGLTEDWMNSSARDATNELRVGASANVVVALGHIGFNGSLYEPQDTGCKQLVEPLGAEPNALGLDINVVSCGHDHAIKWIFPEEARAQNRYAVEAGSLFSCPKLETHANSPECNVTTPDPYFIPYPRIARLLVSLKNGEVEWVSNQFLDHLEPMYLSTYHSQPCDPSTFCTKRSGKPPLLTLSLGQTVTLTVGVRNLGSRTWYRTEANDGYRVHLDTVNPWTGVPEPSLGNVDLSVDLTCPDQDPIVCAVPSGKLGWFTFQLSIPTDKKKAKDFTFRVVPVASRLDGSSYWMNRGDPTVWDVKVKK